MTQDIVSGGGRIVLMPYGDIWRRLRKIMHQILSTRQASTYKDYQDLESKQLLWDYLHTTDKWFLHNGRFSNSGTPLLPWTMSLCCVGEMADDSDHVGGIRKTGNVG